MIHCAKCGGELHRYRDTETNDTGEKCLSCGKMFPDNPVTEGLPPEKEGKRQPVKGTSEDGRVALQKCPECQEEFRGGAALARHKKEKHPRTSDVLKLEDSRVTITHSDEPPIMASKVWQCEHCERTFTTQQGWAAHQVTHQRIDYLDYLAKAEALVRKQFILTREPKFKRAHKNITDAMDTLL